LFSRSLPLTRLCCAAVDVALKCSVLMVNGTRVTQGASVTVHEGASGDLAITTLRDGLAVLCFRDNSRLDKEGYGRCAALNAEAGSTSLQYNHAVVANAASTDHLILTQLDKNKALLCYTSCPDGCMAACKILAAAGSALVVGSPSQLSNSFAHTGLALTSFDSSKAVACYHDSEQNGTAQCNVLTMAGTTVDVGPKQFLTTRKTYNIVLAHVGPEHVLACYNWDNGNSQCSTVKIKGTNASTIEILDGGNMFMHLDIASLADGLLVSCISDLLQEGVAKCRTIQISYAASDTTGSTPKTTSKDVVSTTSASSTTVPVLKVSTSQSIQAPVRCAVLHNPGEQYVIDECANTLAGDICLVKCNYDDGWTGSPARFMCPTLANPEDTPLPVEDWPSCSRTWSQHIGMIAGAGGIVLGALSCVAAVFCPGGIRDCIRHCSRPGMDKSPQSFAQSSGRSVVGNIVHIQAPSDNADNQTNETTWV